MRLEKRLYSRTCLIAIVAILLNAVSWAAEGKVQTAKYVDYVAELNKLGMAGRSENLNAAPFYQKAIELYVHWSDEQRKLATKGWLADLPTREQQLLREWVQSNSQALSQLELGSKQPYCWFRLSSRDGTILSVLTSHLSEYTNLGRAIRVRAKFSAAEGNMDKAIADVVTYYRCGLHLMGPNKMSNEQLTSIGFRTSAVQTAFDILDRTKPNKDLLADLQRQIEGLFTNESYIPYFRADKFTKNLMASFAIFSYIPDFRADKFTVLDIIQRIFTDDGKGDGQIDIPSAKKVLLERGAPEKSLEFMQKLGRRKTIETTEKLYSYLDRIAQKAPCQWKTERIDPDPDIATIVKENPLFYILANDFFAISLSRRHLERFARCRADTDGLITTLALLRYKADKGQFPDKLDELVSAGYLKALRSDPFSGRPFAYKRAGEDFVLYSFGTNLKDDGGKLGLNAKGQPTRWTDEGDMVFWPVLRQ